MGEANRRTAGVKIPAPRYVMDNPYFMRIAEATSGMPLDKAMQALFDHLVQCIGLATDDLEKAESVGRQTGDDLARAIRNNWIELTDARRLMREPAAGKRPS